MSEDRFDLGEAIVNIGKAIWGLQVIRVLIPYIILICYSLPIMFPIYALVCDKFSEPDPYIAGWEAQYKAVVYNTSLSEKEKVSKYHDIDYAFMDADEIENQAGRSHDPYSQFENFLFAVVAFFIVIIIFSTSLIIRDTFRALDSRFFHLLYWAWIFLQGYLVTTDGQMFFYPSEVIGFWFLNPDHSAQTIFTIVNIFGFLLFGFLMLGYHLRGMELLKDRFCRIKFVARLYQARYCLNCTDESEIIEGFKKIAEMPVKLRCLLWFLHTGHDAIVIMLSYKACLYTGLVFRQDMFSNQGFIEAYEAFKNGEDVYALIDDDETPTLVLKGTTNG